MARPPAKDLTERELEVMHVFWKHGEQTAAEARDRLADAGLDPDGVDRGLEAQDAVLSADDPSFERFPARSNAATASPNRWVSSYAAWKSLWLALYLAIPSHA